MGGAVSAGEDNNELVENLLDAKYITSETTARVFRAIDRGDYFPPDSKHHAYKDLAWKHGNIHLSAPCIYCEVVESFELKEGLSFLNLGSGTGYLSTMIGLVLGPMGVNHGVEIYEDVVDFAKSRVQNFIQKNPHFKGINFCEPCFIVGNCLCMNTTYRQYDRVYCGAACPPEHEEYMKSLLKIGGILVMPLKDKLQKIRKTGPEKFETEDLLPVSFAPLILPYKSSRDCTDLIEIASSPWTLQDLCRLCIRRSLHPERTHKVVDLPLPQSLINYLNYYREVCAPVKKKNKTSR